MKKQVVSVLFALIMAKNSLQNSWKALFTSQEESMRL